jgi:hypothetical protein
MANSRCCAKLLLAVAYAALCSLQLLDCCC